MMLLLIIIFSAAAAPLISPHDPTTQNVREKLAPPAWQAEGSWSHPLGTDQLGRDMLSRILYGGRVSLLVALFATAAASILGIALGVLAGYFGRYTDAVIMRLVDIQMAFPSILLALAVMVMLGPSFRNLIIVLAISSWVFFSRVIRADVLTLRNRDFVTSARAIGATHPRVIGRYVFPNLVGVITVVATLTIARVVISEASLSFLGLGIQPPTSSWGLMLAEGRRYLSVAWWITTFPGLALMATVIGVNLLGDALRDVLDPQLIHED
jgi:peptide/nickel transport system permease protein